MPATQHDLVLWVAGGSFDVVFDAAQGMIATLRESARLADEVEGWSYHRDLDLTGFIDGTENPSMSAAPANVLVPSGQAGAGRVGPPHPEVGPRLRCMVVAEPREAGAGDRPHQAGQRRTRPTARGLARRPNGSRRVRPYPAAQHGIPGRSAITARSSSGSAPRRHLCLRCWRAWRAQGTRDALTLYSKPLTGAYYFVPSWTTSKPSRPMPSDVPARDAVRSGR